MINISCWFGDKCTWSWWYLTHSLRQVCWYTFYNLNSLLIKTIEYWFISPHFQYSPCREANVCYENILSLYLMKTALLEYIATLITFYTKLHLREYRHHFWPQVKQITFWNWNYGITSHRWCIKPELIKNHDTWRLKRVTNTMPWRHIKETTQSRVIITISVVRLMEILIVTLSSNIVETKGLTDMLEMYVCLWLKWEPIHVFTRVTTKCTLCRSDIFWDYAQSLVKYNENNKE